MKTRTNRAFAIGLCDKMPLLRSALEGLCPLESISIEALKDIQFFHSGRTLLLAPLASFEKIKRVVESFKSQPSIFCITSEPDFREVHSALVEGVSDVFYEPVDAQVFRAKTWMLFERSNSEFLNLDSFSDLTKKELAIVRAIAQRPELKIARDDLVREVWGETQVSRKTLDVHLFNIRCKLNQRGLEIHRTNFSEGCLLKLVVLAQEGI